MGATRVLIVDDEPVVLELLSGILRRLGYEVFPASSGQEALEIVHSGPVPDLVISDVVMPGMRGPELIEILRREAPGVAAMLISAYGAPAKLASGIHFLQKPFLPKTLANAVERALAMQAPPPANPVQSEEAPLDHPAAKYRAAGE